jgi:clostripain
MVYLDADNNLEQSGLGDLNEMEAAGETGRVHVLVQIDRAVGVTDAENDWTEARRYVIQADKDRNSIASKPVESLGEVNMGDPQQLADFLAWGVVNYPANRYALVLWDHGAGWNGIAFDDDVGFPGETDHISLADLEDALAIALAQTNLDKLDVIAFDACLMGQLDVFQAIQSHADYAVASEEVTPGRGWDYEALFRRLFADPTQDGAELALLLVDEFAAYYRLAEPDDFVTMTAVDLAEIPNLTHSVERLAAALSAEPAFVTSAVGDARIGAVAYARVYPDEFERYASIDLRHFASLLAQRSPDEHAATIAEEVTHAVEAAVIANENGVGLKNSGGIAIYFPQTADAYVRQYEQVTSMPGWDRFLRDFHAANLAESPAPLIGVSNLLTDSIGVQNPAYLEFEIIGRDIESVALVGGRYEEDGRSRMLEYDYLIPEPTHLPDGSQVVEWRDGVHEDFFVWESLATFLHDLDGNGDFAVMWPMEAGGSHFAVQGRYRRAEESEYLDASVVFDLAAGQATGVWGLQGEAAAELMPEPGDEFQLYSYYRLPNGEMQKEPGDSLFFDDAGLVYFDWRPLPDGDYFLGFVAENVAGNAAEAITDLVIDNSHNQPGLSAYLDPYLGFQFLYPQTWHAPIYDGPLLYATNISGTTQLRITLYPNLERGTDAATLQTDALNQFGPVDLLYPTETMAIGGTRGLRTIYGYVKDGTGPRTGIFFTLVKDNVGYVVDFDGPLEDEASTLSAANALLDSWQFRPARFGMQPGDWATIELEAFSVAQPTDFAYQEVNGWQRFSSDRFTFVALRTQPSTSDAAEALAALIRDAGRGVNEFEAGDPFRYALAGNVWLRSEFGYQTADGGEIWGFIMVRNEEDTEIVAWSEAPSSKYNSLESDIFLTMIADMSLAP